MTAHQISRSRRPLPEHDMAGHQRRAALAAIIATAVRRSLDRPGLAVLSNSPMGTGGSRRCCGWRAGE